MARQSPAPLNESTGLKWTVVAALLATIVVNTLANTIRIGGYTTGEVSALYPNLFTPSGLTFSIWGVIYTLLAGYGIYQFQAIRLRTKSLVSEGLYFSLSPLIILSCVVNIAWIFAFHFQFIGLSAALIGVLFVILVGIVWRTKVETRNGQSWLDYTLVTLPFVVYLGWITVAIIANTIAWTVATDWPVYANHPAMVTMAAIGFGTILGAGICWWLKDGFYGLVLVWAFVGILLKHLDTTGHNSQYLLIIALLIAVIVALAALTGLVTFRRFRQTNTTQETA